MQSTVMKKWLCMFLGAWLLSSCAAESPVVLPPLSFKRYAPIHVNVSSIQIVDEYKSPMKAPYVEHLLPYSPADAIRIWVKDRLRPVGAEKSMQVIIKDGSVIASVLHSDNNIEDFFTVDQDKRYDAKLDVELRIYGANSAMSEASVQVSAKRSITMSENASAYQRDKRFREMISNMMEQVNAELEKNMFQYMGNHINFSQNP
jgi:hypothetical protein